jgi:protein-S-isoprenylcysteine O-methyltransferase Ste14
MEASTMSRFIAFAYGLISYAVFFVTFLYMIGFLGDFGVPRSIDSGPEGSVLAALAVNLGLILLFAVQHSVMARPAFKKKWTRIVPKAVERSTYVMITSLILILMFWQWRAMPGVVWSVENSVGRALIWAVFAMGWGIVLYATFLIDHFDLFGLRQVWLNLRGKAYRHLRFKVVSLYKYVRHPLLLGFMLAFWAAPRMTVGHLVFCLGFTLYIQVAVRLEEKDLVRFHGKDYEAYQRHVSRLVPVPKHVGVGQGSEAGKPPDAS